MKNFILLFLLSVAGVYAQTDVVKFKANIANRNSDMITISGKDFKKEIKVSGDGNFSDSFSVPKKGIYEMFDGTEYAMLYLANGYDLSLKMDAKQFDESIVFTGKGSKENNYLAQKTLQDEKLEMAMAADEKTFKEAMAASGKWGAENLKDSALDTDFKTMVMTNDARQAQMMTMMYNQAQMAKKMEGNPSPTFKYENHKGGTTSLEDLKGKYVYIDTWATWCGPCRAEIPFLKKVEEKYHGKNIEFVSISIDVKKDHEKWKQFVKDKELGGVQLFADNDWNSDFIKAYGITSIPRFILIGPDGKVVHANAERPSSPMLQQQLDKLLN